MDTQPTYSNQPINQPQSMSLAAAPQKPSYFLPIMLSSLITMLIMTVGYFLFVNKDLTTKEVVVVSPTPTATSAAITPAPSIIAKTPTTLDTTGWHKYSGSEFVYQNEIYANYNLLFPQTCTLKGGAIDCNLEHGSVTIDINAGGHGGEPGNYKTLKNNEPKIIPAGSGAVTQILNMDTNMVTGTFWINKTDLLTQEPIFGFEFTNVPYQDLAEFEKLFDDILSTFTFTK